jgi:hypothetical protein
VSLLLKEWAEHIERREPVIVGVRLPQPPNHGVEHNVLHRERLVRIILRVILQYPDGMLGKRIRISLIITSKLP